jgi:hypothetical protein
MHKLTEKRRHFLKVEAAAGCVRPLFDGGLLSAGFVPAATDLKAGILASGSAAKLAQMLRARWCNLKGHSLRAFIGHYLHNP